MVDERSPRRKDLPIDLVSPFREWFAGQIGELRSSVERSHAERRELADKIDHVVDAVHDLSLDLKLATAGAIATQTAIAKDIVTMQQALNDPRYGVIARTTRIEQSVSASDHTMADLEAVVQGSPGNPEQGMVSRLESLETWRTRAIAFSAGMIALASVISGLVVWLIGLLRGAK